jgi:ribA/ribD-fused uncharacterized protein
MLVIVARVRLEVTIERNGVMTEPVLFYGGEFGYSFSNFASFAVTWRGRWAMTSEHHYQASKFTDPEIIDEIYAANSAHDALKLAHKYEDEGKRRPDWCDELKESIMYEIISCKHDQHPYIQKQLQKSIGRVIVEDSPTDSFWGRGPDWKGLNKLGELWMRLRTERYPA